MNEFNKLETFKALKHGNLLSWSIFKALIFGMKGSAAMNESLRH